MSIHFPEEFDPDFYRVMNKDLRKLNTEQAHAHYLQYGREEGRFAAPCAVRSQFLALLPPDADVLEIGPYFSPSLKGKNVRYYDVYTAEELRNRCILDKGNPKMVPWKIHYVSKTGDLSIVDRKFDYVFSSHCLEHQPDLIRHLIDVENILTDSGQYLLIVPDKRYCFDHFKGETNIYDLLDAYLSKRIFHTYKNLGLRCLGTHNEPNRHWEGDNGTPTPTKEKIEESIRLFTENIGSYVNCHAWFFTPETFRSSMLMIHELGLTSLYPDRVYNTLRPSHEFCAVMSKKAKTAKGALS